MKNGTVYLVGAGPGDPGLLTLRAAELIRKADILIYDALVSPAILGLAPAGAEVIYVGKRSRDHALSQEGINELLVAKAAQGATIVRLKGGDPYVFGRGGEEAERLAEAGVPFEVVPGISSAIAAPNYAGIPITHREHCSMFSVITGHEDPTKADSSIDWAAIARVPGTKVILMGIERLRVNMEQLQKNGTPASTPVALVRWGTTGKQETLVGKASDIADKAEKVKFAAPAVTVIGGVVSLRKTLNWFEKRPLFGKRVVVTRTRQQASQLSDTLREQGAEILEIPTIRIEPPADRTPIVEAIASLGSYDWLIFTSPNGVTSFFDLYWKAADDIRMLGPARIAAIGPATAAKLKELHLRVDVVPPEYIATKIAKAINEYETVENLKFLLLRAEVANPELPRSLEELGGIVDDVACYRTVPETEDRSGVVADFEESGADWITFASSSAVENFHARFDLPRVKNKFPNLRLASIGPETSKAVVTLGLKPDIEAAKHTIAGLAEAVERASKKARTARA